MDDAAAAISFVRRLQSTPNIYGVFRKIMRAYGTNKLDDPAVVSILEILFQSHHNLLTDYRNLLPPQFRPSLHSLQPPRNNLINADMKILGPCIDFMNKLQKRFGDKPVIIRNYVDTIRALTKGKLSANAAYDEIAKIFGNKNEDLVDEFELILGDDMVGKKFKKRKLSSASSDDLKKDEEIESRRQKYDLILRKEDEMFELDVRLDLVRTTVEPAKKLMEILDSAGNQQKNVDITKYFSVLSLSCIWKEYRGKDSFIVNRLMEDPKRVLPQILLLLETREKELELATQFHHENTWW